jgi:integrase/recombinase XerD
VRVVKEREGGIVRRVHLLHDDDEPIVVVSRFLDHLAERSWSPHTLCAYGYDLQQLFTFLASEQLAWQAFEPADALRFLAFLRRRQSQRPAQRLGLTLLDGGEAPGRRLSAATVNRILAGVASFYEWAIAAQIYTCAESPIQLREDPALARVADRHLPFMGRASRQRPVRRVVAVKQPLRLPRPMAPTDVEALLSSLTRLRDLAIFLLMLDGGLRPGEVLSLHLEDVAYGQRRVTIRKRDDHPRGARGKSRAERVVDLHEPRTLNAVSQYVLHERPREALHPFLFMVGGKGARRVEPLGYDAVVRLFARHLERLGLRSPEKTPHALRHTHATAMWEGGMRELSLQKRLGHASPDSTKMYTRISDEQVLADYTRALETQR